MVGLGSKPTELDKVGRRIHSNACIVTLKKRSVCILVTLDISSENPPNAMRLNCDDLITTFVIE